MRFVKGHGTENDFVLLLDPEREIDLTPQLVAALCDRRSGVGADGVLRVVLTVVDPEGAPMSDEARWFMDYRNADGSVAEMCGNGLRVFARYLVDQHLEPAGSVRIATRAGVLTTRLAMLGDVTVDLGPYGLPDLGALEVHIDQHTWPAYAVTMPNPHAVAMVENLAHAGDLAAPPAVLPVQAYPDGVNVELVTQVGPHHLGMRVHERGVGETRSCGTGAGAAAVAAALSAGELSPEDPPADPLTYRVDAPGGRLSVTVRPDGGVDLAGPAVLVASGVLEGEWLQALTERATD